MRLPLAAIAILLLGSMPYSPPQIRTDAPELYISSFGTDCTASAVDATVLARQLGFSTATTDCHLGRGLPLATLSGEALPKNLHFHNLVAYRQLLAWPWSYITQPFPRPVVIPSSVPFVAASGKIVAFVKPDRMLISLRADDVLRTAFALEYAGISRADIASIEGRDDAKLVVGVEPLSVAQVQKIIRIATSSEDSYGWPVQWAAPFIGDCAGTNAALGAIALREARHHAGVMASAARLRVERILAVVDYGAVIPGALCAPVKGRTVRDLLKTVLNAGTNGLLTTPKPFVTATRSISAAWRLDLPPNSPGQSWRANRAFREDLMYTPFSPAFLADGSWARSDSVLPTLVEANRATIIVTQRAFDLLKKTQNAPSVTDIWFDLGPSRPAVVLHASTGVALQKEVESTRALLARSGGLTSESAPMYWRDNCDNAVDGALAKATRSAIALAKGAKLRFLEELNIGKGESLSCTPQPLPSDESGANGNVPPTTSTWASVAVGY